MLYFSVMKQTTLALKIAIIFTCLCLPLASIAQAGFASTDVTDTPIDGGISLLVAAGIGYGAKKLYNKRQAKKEVCNN